MVKRLKELREKIYLNPEQPGLDIVEELIEEAEKEQQKIVKWENIERSPKASLVLFISAFFAIYGIYEIITYIAEKL